MPQAGERSGGLPGFHAEPWPLQSGRPLRETPAMRWRERLGVVCVSLLAAPVPADAATVNVRLTPNGTHEMVFVASPGERNDVALDFVLAGGLVSAFTVRDSGAVLVAGTGCEVIDSHAAGCRLDPVGNAWKYYFRTVLLGGRAPSAEQLRDLVVADARVRLQHSESAARLQGLVPCPRVDHERRPES